MPGPETALASIKWRWQQAPLGPYREEGGVVVDIRGTPLSVNETIVLHAWEDIQALIELLESVPESDPSVDKAYRQVVDAHNILDDAHCAMDSLGGADKHDLHDVIDEVRSATQRAMSALDNAIDLLYEAV